MSLTRASTNGEGGVTVAVTRKGQATIPQRFRERYDIEAPGKVRFLVNDEGDPVVEPVTPIADFRGAGHASQSAGDLLTQPRAADRERDETLLREDDH